MQAVVPLSTKQQIVQVAERLFAAHGLDGVSLRQIGVAAGSGNKSAVQYHFGSKERLVQAIFEFRLPELQERRELLEAQLRPTDLRPLVECYVLPILEQGERAGSHYLSFVAMLQQHPRRDLFATIPAPYQAETRMFYQRAGMLITHVPEPVRTHRLAQALGFSVHAAAVRERARDTDQHVLPFAVHVNDLLDGLVAFLEAPVSDAALAALTEADPEAMAWPLVV